MLTEIESLIDHKEYEKALNQIDYDISQITDYKSDEKTYTDLLQLRVGVKQQLGEVDAIIRDQVRRDLFPSETIHLVAGKFPVKLIYKVAFLEKCDAYVNTVFIENPFQNVSDRSASIEFIKKMGAEEVEKQVNVQKGKEAGDFIILQHDKLSAPMSYHILFYSNDDSNIDLLEKGIKKVLDDACQRKLSKLSFFPLGFGLVNKSSPDQKNSVAESIADRTAEIIIGYINDNQRKAIPEITFNFVTVLTMITYEKAFNKWVNYDKNYFNIMRQIEKTQKIIIEAALTKDPNYIEKLKDLTSIINEGSPILFLGESGVGKSFLARILHRNSLRASKKIKELNCSKIRGDTIYAQLFGWKKGSYTGAINDGPGAIGAAEGSTLFLDEIGYADLEVQQMLLKFVEERQYSRLGEEETVRSANVKLIFGTNVDIQKNIDKGIFSHDLYERISGNEITIPPLRDRRDDIPLLVTYFLREINNNNSISIEVPESAMKEIMSFNWPGNTRQLQLYIEKLVRKARRENVNKIKIEYVKNDPPRNEMRKKNTLKNVEDALSEALNSWSSENGNLLDEVIKPILANIYVKEFKGNVKKSGKMIGMDGTRGNVSTLTKNLEKFKEMMKKSLLG